MSGLRRDLVRWATCLRVPAETTNDLGLAVYEALANSVLHAYPRGTLGMVELRAGVVDGALRVSVIDRGRWTTGGPPADGRGLPLIRGLADEATIVRGRYGTTVQMSWRLARV